MLIYGNPILFGGGAAQCAVELHGGPGETVTWSDGTNSGTVTLSGTGDNSLTLPAGGYTFSFSLGIAVTGAIAATIASGVTNVVNGWGTRTPAYWFGREFGYGLTSGTNATYTFNSTYISMSNYGAGSTNYTFRFNTMTQGNCTMAKAYVDTTGKYNSIYPKALLVGSNITSNTGYAAPNTGVTLTGTVEADTTLGVVYRPSGSSTAGGINLYAIWLE